MTLSPTSSPEQPVKPIGHLAIRGMIWSIGQSLGTKSVTLIQQLLIAKFFLRDEDFGLIAVSQVVISIASLGQSLGVGEILVRRHRRFARWVDSGFWLNLTGGLIGLCLVLTLIPFWDGLFLGISNLFGGHVTEAPEVQGLLAIWGLWLPLDAMTAIINARLRVEMRFRSLALLGTMHATGLAILGLALAWLGLGAYSLVLPVPFMSVLTVTIGWILSRQRIRWKLDFRRWRMILRDSRFFMLGSVFNVLLQQGDYMLTSVFFPKGLLGTYYFAYRMSTQSVQLVGANMMSVLLPSFSRIDDDEQRRTIAYQRTCATLLLFGMPLCFLQALLAEPVFHLLFRDKWNTALPLFQVLSIAMAFTIPMTAAMSLLLSQGRYRLQVTWNAIMAGGLLLFVLTGALQGSVFHVACFVAVFYVLMGPITVVIPVRHSGVSRFLWQAYGFPLLAGTLAVGTGWGLSHILPWQGSFAVLIVRTVGFLTVFLLALALIKPRPAVELAARLGGNRGRHPSGDPPSAVPLMPTKAPDQP